MQRVPVSSIMHSTEHRAGAKRNRQGFLSIIVLVGLAVVGVLASAILKLAIAQRVQAQRETVRLQCEWLAEAGLERAAARIAQDPEYHGETWEISAETLGGREPAAVSIEIETGESGSALMSVIAVYPLQAERRVRITRKLPIAVSNAP